MVRHLVSSFGKASIFVGTFASSASPDLLPTRSCDWKSGAVDNACRVFAIRFLRPSEKVVLPIVSVIAATAITSFWFSNQHSVSS